MMRPIALTVAGSDPSGGAGIQSDLRTFHSLDAIGTSVITAITAQNTRGVSEVFPVEGAAVARQLQVLLGDTRPGAVKIGMLGSSDQARAVADAIRKYDLQNVALDPMLASTGGVPLLDDAGIAVLLHELAPLCSVITPNIAEAARLTGLAVHTVEEMEAAAKHLIERGAKAVIVKGGHLNGPPTDVLVLSDGTTELCSSPRIETPHTHGAGCLYSSALTVFLARGMTLNDAFYAAKDLMGAALKNPVVIGGGRGYPEMGDRRRSRLCPIYIVTDPRLRPDRSHLEVARAALEGGARLVQLRDKYAPDRELIETGRAMAALCRDYGAVFIVNDRVDIALACRADGVHLGPGDMHPAEAREILGPDRIIGVSVNSIEEAAPLIPYATYLGVGAVFGSSTKIDAGDPIGIGRIREIKAAFPSVPLVAIGGIGHHNIADVFAAGADTAAVVSAIVCAEDMVAATRKLVSRQRSLPDNAL